MGKSDNSAGQSAGGMPRPSLLNVGAGAASPNILDAMAKGPAASGAKSRARLVWLLAPLTIAAALWVLLPSLRSTPASGAPDSLAASPQPLTEPLQPAAAPLAQALEAPTTAMAEPPEREDTVAPAPEPAASPFAGLERAEAASAAAAATAVNNPPQQATEAVVAKAAPVKAASPPKPQTTPKVTASNSNAAPQSNRPQTIAAKTRPTPSTARNDPDVALIDALMKHMGAPKPALNAQPSVQTIADLARSCQSKDSIEGLLCRRRICDGYWGKAQACPAELAPKQAAAVPN